MRLNIDLFSYESSSDNKQTTKIDLSWSKAGILDLTWITYFSEGTGPGAQEHQIWCLYHQGKD